MICFPNVESLIFKFRDGHVATFHEPFLIDGEVYVPSSWQFEGRTQQLRLTIEGPSKYTFTWNKVGPVFVPFDLEPEHFPIEVAQNNEVEPEDVTESLFCEYFGVAVEYSDEVIEPTLFIDPQKIVAEGKTTKIHVSPTRACIVGTLVERECVFVSPLTVSSQDGDVVHKNLVVQLKAPTSCEKLVLPRHLS